MINQELKNDFAKFILRLSVGGLMLFHGVHKLTHGLDGIGKILISSGMPEILKYGVPVGEVIAPLLIILGIFVRPSALIVAFTMAFSIYLVFKDKLFALNETTGAWIIELNVLYFASALAIALIGSGRFSLQPSNRK